MGTTRTRRAVGALAGLALLVAGCGDDEDDDAGSATTTEAPADEATTTTAADDEGEDGEAIAVQAVDYAFSGLPEELEGGAVTFAFENTGEVDHELAFVELAEDTGAEQFFTDFAPVVMEGGAWPEYAQDAVGAVEAPPGQSGDFTFTMPEGRYMAFCTLTGDAENPASEEGGAPHFERGMQQIVTVTGGDAGELPEAEGTITSTDYTFELDIPAGAQVINFVNDGPNEVHFAGVDRFPEGTTVEDAEAAFRTLTELEEGQAPPAGTPESEELFFSGIASAGLGIQSTSPTAFEPGTYIAYCFISDRAGGPPHAIAYEMFKAFTIE